jgi:hypothetical protein
MLLAALFVLACCPGVHSPIEIKLSQEGLPNDVLPMAEKKSFEHEPCLNLASEFSSCAKTKAYWSGGGEKRKLNYP